MMTADTNRTYKLGAEGDVIIIVVILRIESDVACFADSAFARYIYNPPCDVWFPSWHIPCGAVLTPFGRQQLCEYLSWVLLTILYYLPSLVQICLPSLFFF